VLRLESLEDGTRVVHGFFTRAGGVSEGIFASLNCGLGSGDEPERVRENRARVTAALGLGGARLTTSYQIHSPTVVTVEAAWNDGDRPQADAMVTDRPGVVLGILTADCVPILFADAEAGVIGAAHAGWKGARDGVAEATVAAMTRLGARRERIRSGIGPAIRQPSYEVGPEFPGHFPDGAAFFRPSPREGRHLFDLPGYVASRLARLGLGRIEDLGLDTAAEPGRFFSYRRATLAGEPDYGRMISAIAIA
jgi:hypothetical protein